MADKQGKANFIWKIADDILRGSFKAHEYGDVILPFNSLNTISAKKGNLHLTIYDFETILFSANIKT
ncbi:type I restriction-modification system subunit M N-terminal domain-containing protein [Sedimentisphaera salicampi]|uniref:type I restriction-modification system subunit M N-terminal domain-containing protein n=1 Tax=Sedimentisphaera salicampi TaxID=1941349 RepID=UPI000B9B9F69|nr:hypothetical protein SMSP1_01228 [Sedimentisphaera salicampi]